MTVQIKTFYVVGMKKAKQPWTEMERTQDRLQTQINNFILTNLNAAKYTVGDIRIWAGVDPLSLHGMIVYQVN